MIRAAVTATLLAVSPLASLAGGEAAGAGHPPASVALAAAPVRLQLSAASSRTIQVTNPGGTTAVVDVAPGGYAVDAHGRPRVGVVGHGSAGRWIRVVPRRLALRPAGRASLALSAVVPRGARPGDHTALLLLTTQPLRSGSVPARVRIGVVVVVRVPGRIIRRLLLRGLAVRRRGRGCLLELSIVDRGNVDEWVGARRLSISLARRGHLVARLRPLARRFLARSSGLIEARCRSGLRGEMNAVVRLSRPRPGLAAIRRTYRIRL
jgi:hypothetical protein